MAEILLIRRETLFKHTNKHTHTHTNKALYFPSNDLCVFWYFHTRENMK